MRKRITARPRETTLSNTALRVLQHRPKLRTRLVAAAPRRAVRELRRPLVRHAAALPGPGAMTQSTIAAMIQPSQTWYAGRSRSRARCRRSACRACRRRRGCSPAWRPGSSGPSRWGARRSARRRRSSRRTSAATSANAAPRCGGRAASREATRKARPYAHRADGHNRNVNESERHLRLLTETIDAVNSSLDLEEVLGLIARARRGRARGRRVLRLPLRRARGRARAAATHGTHVEELTRTPRMRPGEGITGSAAAERAPVMTARGAPRPALQVVPEPARGRVRVDPGRADRRARRAARGSAERQRTLRPRTFTDEEIDLLVAIATQVAQSIEHAQLYSQAQRRVHELESLARISEAVSESLYLEESLEAIVKTTMATVRATGAALVLEDGNIAWPEGRAGAYAVRLPLRWKRRQIGSSSATATRRSRTRNRRCSRRSRRTRRSRSSTGAR